jgi:transcriptional regulator with XRE-family HTH domain
MAKARTDSHFTQAEIAMLLGMTQTNYAKYENGRGKDPSSLLPHELIWPFCLACRVDPVWLLTGTGSIRLRKGND